LKIGEEEDDEGERDRSLSVTITGRDQEDKIDSLRALLQNMSVGTRTQAYQVQMD